MVRLASFAASACANPTHRGTLAVMLRCRGSTRCAARALTGWLLGGALACGASFDRPESSPTTKPSALPASPSKTERPHGHPESSASSDSTTPSKSPHGNGRRAQAADAEVVATLDRQVGVTPISISIRTAELELGHDVLADWIAACARAVADYYGGFPVPQLDVDVVAGRGDGIGFGQAFSGRRIRLYVGAGTTQTDLDNDWVLVHEMLHMGFPFLHERHGWMREGLSTYLEPIVRARAGWTSDEQVWRRWLERMPLGLPGDGDRGLDRTRTWGNTYWGGALFWLLLDVELRQATDNAYSIEPMLRQVVAAGGHARVTWPIEKVCRQADAGAPVPAFTQLYRSVAEQPIAVDLPDLFERLGVRLDGTGVAFDDNAPWAHVRRAITRASAS